MISFEHRYMEFIDKVYWYILRKVRNSHEAEDLASQTFLKAYQSYATLTDQDKFAPWIFKIAHNLSMDYFRRTKQDLSEDLDKLPSDHADPMSNVISNELSKKIQFEIKSLSKEEQDLLDLRFIGELTFREIAGVLRRNESSVKKDYYKLIRLLRSRLE